LLFIAAAPAAQAQCQEQPRSREWGEVVKRGECINRRKRSAQSRRRFSQAAPASLKQQVKAFARRLS
jgi:hypothetical protein